MRIQLIVISAIIATFTICGCTRNMRTAKGNIIERPVKADSMKVKSQIIADHVSEFCISPNSHQVAFIDSKGLELASIDGRNKKLLLHLYSEPAQWTADASWPAYEGTNISWAPDGSMVAVSAVDLRERFSKLIIIDIKKGYICSLDKAAIHSQLTWSPDSKKLAWTASYGIVPSEGLYSTDGDWRVMTATIVNSSGRLQATKVHCLSKQWDVIAWTDESSHLAIGLASVAIIDTDSSAIVAPSAYRMYGKLKSGRVTTWALSPDMKTMIFGTSPSISRPPDHTKIPGILWSRLTAGGKVEQLLINCTPVAITWTSDNKSILFANDSGMHIATGADFISGPPHVLHIVSATGQDDRELWVEKEGIRKMQCTRDGMVIYITWDSYKLCIARY